MLSQSSVNSVSGKTGLSNKQIQKLVMLALPILIKYMTQNASSGDGALSLLGALSQHKNNNSMDLQLKDADEAYEKIKVLLCKNKPGSVKRTLRPMGF
jgi:hypothetical protein